MKTVSRSKNAIFNIFFTLLAQGATVISGLILPRLVISTYGSDVNGLLASITQFLSYISLLEAGIGGVMGASLYKPLAEFDMKKVSGVISAGKSFYKKIAVIFIFYIAAMCFIYPVINKSGFDIPYIVGMIIILSISTFLQYFFAIPYVSLITADQKVRIVHIITSITILINVLTSFVLIKAGAGIHAVKFISALVFAVKPVFYAYYIKKNYKLDYKASGKGELKQRWNGLAHHIAYFVQNSTDVVIVTFFMQIEYVSVYYVYYTVIWGLAVIIVSIANGSSAGIGNLIVSEDKAAVNKVVDVFEFVQSGVTTIVYTITALMLIPFIKLYTNGVTDVNYIDPLFGYFMVIAMGIYCIRYIYSTVTLSANRYKETQVGAILECTSNVVLSVILIKPLGLTGVAAGTAVSMLIRCVYDLVYLSKHVVLRPVTRFLRTMGVNLIACAVSIILCKMFINYEVSGWIDWLVKGVYSGIIVCLTAFAVYFVFNRKIMLDLLSRINNIIKTKQ